MTVPAEPTQPVSADMLPPQPVPQQQVFVQGGYGLAPQRFGHPGEVRSPGLVLLLTYVTLGFYAFYAHYKINKEMKDFTSTVNVSPGLATFALIVPIAGLVTTIGTSGRIKQVQTSVGLRADASGFVTFLCMIVGANWAYQQSKLNGVWKHLAAQGMPR
jgi:uncharacterized protein (DUF486 family)